MIRTTLNNSYQTAIPKKVRDALGVKGASFVEWEIDENNKRAIVTFVKKPSLYDITKILGSDE